MPIDHDAHEVWIRADFTPDEGDKPDVIFLENLGVYDAKALDREALAECVAYWEAQADAGEILGGGRVTHVRVERRVVEYRAIEHRLTHYPLGGGLRGKCGSRRGPWSNHPTCEPCRAAL